MRVRDLRKLRKDKYVEKSYINTGRGKNEYYMYPWGYKKELDMEKDKNPMDIYYSDSVRGKKRKQVEREVDLYQRERYRLFDEARAKQSWVDQFNKKPIKADEYSVSSEKVPKSIADWKEYQKKLEKYKKKIYHMKKNDPSGYRYLESTDKLPKPPKKPLVELPIPLEELDRDLWEEYINEERLIYKEIPRFDDSLQRMEQEEADRRKNREYLFLEPLEGAKTLQQIDDFEWNKQFNKKWNEWTEKVNDPQANVEATTNLRYEPVWKPGDNAPDWLLNNPVGLLSYKDLQRMEQEDLERQKAIEVLYQYSMEDIKRLRVIADDPHSVIPQAIKDQLRYNPLFNEKSGIGNFLTDDSVSDKTESETELADDSVSDKTKRETELEEDNYYNKTPMEKAMDRQKTFGILLRAFFMPTAYKDKHSGRVKQDPTKSFLDPLYGLPKKILDYNKSIIKTLKGSGKVTWGDVIKNSWKAGVAKVGVGYGNTIRTIAPLRIFYDWMSGITGAPTVEEQLRVFESSVKKAEEEMRGAGMLQDFLYLGASSAIPTATNLLAGKALGAGTSGKVAKVATRAPSGAYSYGTYSREAELDGATPQQQVLYGLAGASVEILIESIAGKIGPKGLDMPMVMKCGAKKVVDRMGMVGMDALNNMAMEYGQELVGGVGTNFAKKFIYEPDKSLFGEGGIFDNQRMAEDGMGGAVISLVLSSLGLPKKYKSQRMAETMMNNVVEGEKTTLNELEALKDQYDRDLDNMSAKEKAKVIDQATEESKAINEILDSPVTPQQEQTKSKEVARPKKETLLFDKTKLNEMFRMPGIRDDLKVVGKTGTFIIAQKVDSTGQLTEGGRTIQIEKTAFDKNANVFGKEAQGQERAALQKPKETQPLPPSQPLLLESDTAFDKNANALGKEAQGQDKAAVQKPKETQPIQLESETKPKAQGKSTTLKQFGEVDVTRIDDKYVYFKSSKTGNILKLNHTDFSRLYTSGYKPVIDARKRK